MFHNSTYFAIFRNLFEIFRSPHIPKFLSHLFARAALKVRPKMRVYCVQKDTSHGDTISPIALKGSNAKKLTFSILFSCRMVSFSVLNSDAFRYLRWLPILGALVKILLLSYYLFKSLTLDSFLFTFL